MEGREEVITKCAREGGSGVVNGLGRVKEVGNVAGRDGARVGIV